MTTLHMDTEVASATATQMKSTLEELSQALAAMNSSVENLIGGAWEGNSAVEFESLYSDWRGKMDQTLLDLESHANQLDMEIQNWLAAAAKLGG